MKIKEKVIGWWYRNNNIFNFNITISLFHFLFLIKIITFEFKIEFELPYFFFYFTNIKNRFRRITKNKVGEIELLFTNDLITGIVFYKNIHCDHAGIHLEISILGLTIPFSIYDIRHWDYDNDAYEKYEE